MMMRTNVAAGVRALPLDLSFNSSGGTKEVYLVVTKDVELSGLQCAVAQNGQDWCTLELNDNLLKVTVDPTYYEEPRATVVTLSYGELTREIPVSQEASSGSADESNLPLLQDYTGRMEQ